MACVAVACGVLSPEEQLLTDYFEAARLNDTTVMARLSALPFNPRSQGIVDSFHIERVEDAGPAEHVAVVTARVRSFEGVVTSRQFVFTLTRQDGRWFIQAWRAAGAP